MYQVGNFVEMKKPHACTIKSTGKKANRWEITRVGADIKIKCSNCDHVVMMGRYTVGAPSFPQVKGECVTLLFQKQGGAAADG